MTCQTKITRKDAQIQVKDFIRRLNELEQAYIHSSYLTFFNLPRPATAATAATGKGKGKGSGFI